MDSLECLTDITTILARTLDRDGLGPAPRCPRDGVSVRSREPPALGALLPDRPPPCSRIFTALLVALAACPASALDSELTGYVSTVAGTKGQSDFYSSTDGGGFVNVIDGPNGLTSFFKDPTGISLSPDNSFALIVSQTRRRGRQGRPAPLHLSQTDLGHCSIRRLNVATTGVTTVAGSNYDCNAADGVGTSASFQDPNDVAVYNSGKSALVVGWGGERPSLRRFKEITESHSRPAD